MKLMFRFIEDEVMAGFAAILFASLKWTYFIPSLLDTIRKPVLSNVALPR